MPEIVKVIEKPDGTRKVEIFRRADGSFGFGHWKWGEKEQAWFPTAPYSQSRCDTLKYVQREAGGRIEWLAGCNF